MKSKFCSNNLFSVGIIVFLMLFISACSSSGGSDHPPGTDLAITSADNTTFIEGTFTTFTLTATGNPAPTFAIAEPLPAGLTFNGTTGVLSGTPAAGTSGTYPLIITASNGVSPDATQSFTLTVVIPPITSLSEIAQINNGDAAVVICRDNYVYTVGWNGTNNSFNIIDMSDPTTPVTKGTYNVGEGWGLALNGNYAYIQTDGSGDGIFSNGTIGIMNITDPTNPVPVMQNDTGYSSAYQTYYHNGYVYNASDDIISIYSVADPASLVHVTNISTTQSRWLAFSGNYMYSGNNGYLTIWNVSNPITPIVISSVSNADLGNDSGIAVEGNYVFVGSNKKVIVYDVSDKTNPTLVTTLALAGGTSTELTETRILSLPVYDYLLVAGANDFYVVNISDPTAPVEITSFPLSNNDGWGFDVLNDRYAIVADDTVYHVLKLW